MTADQARFWYRHIVNIANKLDAMNAADANANLTYATGNEGLRRIAQEMLGFTEEITSTQEMVAVDWSEAS